MATLIPNVKWTDLIKVQKAGRLEELKSCEITFNSEYVGTWINGNAEPSGYIRTKAEYLAMKSNALPSKTIEEILEVENAPVSV